MSRKIWIQELSFNFSRGVGRRLAAPLAFSLLLVAGMRESLAADSQFAQPQYQNRLAAQRKFDEAKALSAQGTEESMRLAVEKYGEAFALWRTAGDLSGAAKTLNNIGQIFDQLGEKQKALNIYDQALKLYRQAGDRGGEANTLTNVGAVYASQGDNQKAIDLYAEALQVHRALGDRRREALTLNNVGNVYTTLGENQKALELYAQALRLHQAVGNRNGEATTLNNIGSVRESLGERQKAIEFYNQALQIYRAAGDRRGESIALNNIGRACDSLGEKRKALDYYDQSLTLRRESGDRGGEATTLTNIGAVYDSMGEKRKALDFYNQALPLLRAVGARSVEATTLSNVGVLYDSLGEWRKALDYYNLALPLRRAVGDRQGEALTLTSVGKLYDSMGEKRKALDHYNQALALSRAIGDRDGEAVTLNNIGSHYNSLGARKEALDYYNRALALSRATGDRGGEIVTLGNIGAVYNSLDEMQKALDFYNRALALSRESGARHEEAYNLIAIGNFYSSLGEKQKALDFYNQALPIERAIGYREGEADTLGSIGSICMSTGENQRALEFYDKALAIERAIGVRGGESGILTSAGNVYALLGEKRKASEFYDQALRIEIEIGDNPGKSRTLNGVGELLSSAGENQKALNVFNQALALEREIGDRAGEAKTLYNIAAIKRALGLFDEALSYMESALKIVESIRAGVVSKELRASYFATAQSYYEFYIDLLMRMHGRKPAGGYDAAALEAGERARARSLLDSLAEARADIRRGADPKLVEQERSLQQRLNAKAEEALRLSARGADEAGLAALRQEVDALTIDLQQVQTQIRRTNPRYAALTQPQPLRLAEIQRQTLDADTLLLEYSLGKERGFLWAVTPTTINSYELPKREEVEAAAKRVYELLSSAPVVSEQYLAAAAGLSRTLLAPVAGQLGRKRLLIVADGALHYIPFGALPDPNRPAGGGGIWQPLVVEHEIVNLPSASTLAVLRSELAGRNPAAKALAVLADPVFSKDDERLKLSGRPAAPESSQTDPLDESRSRLLVKVAGGAKNETRPGDLRISRLPFTRQEAEQLMALAPAGAGMKALDFQASRATATSDQLSQYRYIHFATHGLADSERPELSTILLSLFDEQGRPQDGFLRAHEIYNLELPAELVTLSACETGLGKLTRGEGLVSLTRGFMYAGAARVVVSLWSVSDRATAELMMKFYRRALVGGERPAAALQAAQVEMWRDKRWEAPYYWAAFTLQGEWR
jgi:CHAT domain-containing protein/Tfp pilus assembly protein PilF